MREFEYFLKFSRERRSSSSGSGRNMGRGLGHHAGSGSTWSATDVLRVCLEGHGVVGFIEVGSATTLFEARSKIASEVEGLDSISGNMFTFLLPDDVPVSRKQESQILAREFLPMILLRESSTAGSEKKGASEKTTAAMSRSSTSAPASPLSTYKLSQYAQHFQNVSRSIPRDSRYLSTKTTVSFLGEQYSIWVTEQYTFSQLRREAAHYFSCNPEHVVLVDEDGCSWPETGLVCAVHELGMLKDKEILLVRKPHVGAGNGAQDSANSAHYTYDFEGNTRSPPGSPTNIVINNLVQNNNANVVSPSHTGARRAEPVSPFSPKSPVSPSPLAHLDGQGTVPSRSASQLQQIGSNPESHAPILSPLGGQAETPGSSRSMQARITQRPKGQLPRAPKPDEMTLSNAGKGVLERHADMWRVFTYYCLQIDSLRPFTMDLRGFVGLLHDCQLVDNHAFGPAIISLVFASHSKDGKHMSFDNFLDALMDITRRLHARMDKARGISPPKKRTPEALMTSFAQLLGNRILPLTASFNVKRWERESALSGSNDLLHLVRRFVKPLYQIFRFYAPAVQSNRMDVEDDLCFFLPNFQAFSQDFKLIDIGVRHQLAEIFLAACQSRGISVESRRNGLRITTAEDIRARIFRESASVVAAQAAETAKKSTLARELGHECEAEEMSEKNLQSPRMLPTKDKVAKERTGPFRFLNSRDGSPIWDNPVLYFGQFLDALLRVSYAAFPQHASVGKPELAFKALIQHFSKCLRRSCVLRIMEKRHSSNTYPLGLMNASNELFKRYNMVWKADGQPDYASEAIVGHDSPCRAASNSPSSPRAKSVVLKHPARTPPASAFTQKRGGDGREVLEKLLAMECEDQEAESKSKTSSPRAACSPAAKRAVSALLGIGPRPGDAAYTLEDDITRFGFLEDFEGNAFEGEGSLVSEEAGSHLQGHSFYDDNGDLESFGGQRHSPRVGRSNLNGRGTAEEDEEFDSNSEYESGTNIDFGTDMDEEKKLEGSSFSNHGERFNDKEAGGHAANEIHDIETKDGEVHIRSINLAGVLDKHAYTMLCRGSVFLKHCRRGEPHRRFVWCDENLKKIYWAPFEQRPKLDKNGKTLSKVKAKSMTIKEIKTVALGLDKTRGKARSLSSWGSKIPFPRTRSRSKSSSSLSSGLSEEAMDAKNAICFSLVGKSRSLDLESDSQEVRDQWASAFQQLLNVASS